MLSCFSGLGGAEALDRRTIYSVECWVTARSIEGANLVNLDHFTDLHASDATYMQLPTTCLTCMQLYRFYQESA